MKLVFKKMTMHNFMVFEDETFDFSAINGMVMIRGRNNDLPDETNGAGKSTIGNALLYALFGETQSIKKNENIVCWTSKDRNLKVTLEFQSDGEEYKIERSLERGKTSVLTLYRIIDENETDITKSTIAETQKFLETEILMCDISIFLRTIILIADQTYNFYMLKKQEKKEFVEKLFDIQAFGEIYKNIHRDVLALDKKAIAKQNQLLVLNRNVSDYENRSIEFENNRTIKIKTIHENLSTAKDECNEFANKTVETNVHAVDKLNEAIDKLTNAVDENRVKITEIDKTLSKIAVAEGKLKTTLEQRRQLVSKHSDVMSKLCNKCRDVFSEYYNLDQAMSEIETTNKKLTMLLEKKSEAKTERIGYSAKNDEYTEKITTARSRIRGLTADAEEARIRLRSLENRVAGFERDLAVYETQVNPYVEMLENTRKQVINETSEIDSLVTKIEYLRFAENIVSQDTLRKFIIKDLIGILNNRIRKYLVKLGAKYYVVFDEDMDFEFIPTIGTCEFGNFSRGEKMRLMIATSFAFRDFMSIRNGLNSNILILDEYFDSAISSAGVLNLMEILKEYRTESNQNIFVITHRPEIQPDMFDKVIVVEKTHDIGHITYSD